MESHSESVVICLDNSEPQSSDDIITQFMVIQDICRYIWQPNSKNKVAILVFAPSARIVQNLTSEVNVVTALNTIQLGEGFDFISGLYIAFQTLEKTQTFGKRMIVFVKNQLFCADNELKKFTEDILNSMPDLKIDLISIGDKVNENRPKFEIIEKALKNKEFIEYDINIIDRKTIIRQLVGTRALDISPADFLAVIKQTEEETAYYDPPNNCEIEDKMYEIEMQKNCINNDQGIDPLSRPLLLKALDEELRDLVPNTKVKLSEPDSEDPELKMAIEISLKENYKDNHIEQVVKGVCNAFKEHSIQHKSQEKSDKKPKKRIKKFREKTKC